MGTEHKEYTWSLVAKKLTGEATPEELLELETLLRNNPDLHYPLQTITDLWNNPVDPKDQKEAAKAFNRHLDRMQELNIDYTVYRVVPDPATPDLQPKKHRSRLVYATALIVALLIVGFFFYQRKPDTLAVTPLTPKVATLNGNAIATGNGSRTHLALPDGTRVWLNAGSRINYGKSFGNTSREVDLTGEAFFDVAPDANKPFIIHTTRLDIRVLGTRFNVKSYPADKTTEATLIKGSIEVLVHNSHKEHIVMRPNDKLVVTNEDSIRAESGSLRIEAEKETDKHNTASTITMSKLTYDQRSGAVVETSWIDNKLIFHDETFEDLAKQMERWYNVSISFNNPLLKELRFTGSFEKETIKQALEALKITADFHYSMEGTQIILDN